MVIESKNNPSAKISAKSADWWPSYGPFREIGTLHKNMTFQNVAKNEVPYLGFQSTDLAEILAVGSLKDSIWTFWNEFLA